MANNLEKKELEMEYGVQFRDTLETKDPHYVHLNGQRFEIHRVYKNSTSKTGRSYFIVCENGASLGALDEEIEVCA